MIKYSSKRLQPERNLSVRYLSYQKLQSLPSNNSGTNENQIKKLTQENSLLRVKCNKIDQIEKYVHILLSNVEHLQKQKELAEEERQAFRQKNVNLNNSLTKEAEAHLKAMNMLRNMEEKEKHQNFQRSKRSKEDLKIVHETKDNQILVLKQEMLNISEKNRQIVRNIEDKLQKQINLLTKNNEILKQNNEKQIQCTKKVEISNQILQKQNEKLMKQLQDLAKKNIILEQCSKKLKQIRQELQTGRFKQKLLVEELNMCEETSKSLINILQKDNIALRSTIQRCEGDNNIKMKEVEDLISIVEKLEWSVKESNENCKILEENNLKIRAKCDAIVSEQEKLLIQIRTLKDKTTLFQLHNQKLQEIIQIQQHRNHSLQESRIDLQWMAEENPKQLRLAFQQEKQFLIQNFEKEKQIHLDRVHKEKQQIVAVYEHTLLQKQDVFNDKLFALQNEIKLLSQRQ